jgi:hypothetical protein
MFPSPASNASGSDRLRDLMDIKNSFRGSGDLGDPCNRVFVAWQRKRPGMIPAFIVLMAVAG